MVYCLKSFKDFFFIEIVKEFNYVFKKCIIVVNITTALTRQTKIQPLVIIVFYVNTCHEFYDPLAIE